MNKFTIILWLFFINLTICSAQSIVVTGTVYTDSADIQSYFIDIKGKANQSNTLTVSEPSFLIRMEQKEMPCHLIIRKEGYRMTEVVLTEAENDSIELGKIRLYPTTNTLNEVVVATARPTMTIRKGIIKVRIEGTPLETMGNLTDMMEYVPGMMRKGDKLEVLGRGKPLYLLNGIEIKDEQTLASLKSEQIQSIEIIKHPSAAYPSGTKAVVNIKTRNVLKDELSVTVGSTTTIKRKFSEYPSAFISYSKKKWLFNLSYDYGQFKNLNKETYYRDIYADNRERTFRAEWQREDLLSEKSHSLRYAMEYRPTEKQLFGVSYLFGHNDEDNPISGLNVENRPTSVTIKDILENGEKERNRQSVNLYWTGQISESSSIQVIQDIYLNSNDKRMDVTETNIENGSTLHTLSDENYRSDIYTSNIKYENEDLASLNCTFGVRYDYFKTKMETGIHEVLKGENISYNRSTSTENIYSAYGEIAKEWDKTMLSVGVRYEYLQRSIDNTADVSAEAEATEQAQHGIYPELNVEYSPNDDWTLSLYYETGLSNPQLSMLNSGTIYSDSLTYKKGNIDIKPTRTHSVALEAEWKMLNVGVSYDYTHNEIITAYTQLNSESDIIYNSPVNIKDVNELGLSLGLYKKWNRFNGGANVYVGFPYSKITYLGEEKIMDMPYSSGNVQLSYEVGPKLNFYTKFSYQSSNESVTTIQKNLNKWDVGLTGKAGNLSYTLSFTDLLHRAHYNNCYEIYHNVKDGTFGTNDMRGLYLSLSYKIFSKQIKTNNKTSNNNILNRL